jgi:hypothetical protein
MYCFMIIKGVQFSPEDGDIILLRNICPRLPEYVVSFAVLSLY